MTINAISSSLASYPHSIHASTQRIPVNQVQPAHNHANNYRYNLYSNAMDPASKLFLRQFENQYRSLMATSQDLSLGNSQNLWQNLSAQAGDDSILTLTTAQYIKQPGQYDLDVQQIAKAQVNQSKKLDSQGSSTLADSQLQLNINQKSYTVRLDATGKTNEEVLSALAKDINSQKIGLEAKVISKDNTSFLQLSGEKTGRQYTFDFSGDSDAINQLGLNEVNQASQNAIVSVTRPDKSTEVIDQASNRVNIDSYRLAVEVQKTGQTKINIGVDQDQLVEGVKNLVASHNETIVLLNDNADKGVAVSRHLASLILPPISEKSMASIGLEYRDNGTLKFDEEKFLDALDKNPDQVKSTLSGTYSVASGFTTDANKALQESAFNLINGIDSRNDPIDTNQYTPQQNITQQIQLASMYSRYGAYNSINASIIGLFFNTLA